MRTATYVAAGALWAGVPCTCSQWATGGGAGVSVSGGVVLVLIAAFRISNHLDLYSFSIQIGGNGSCASSLEMYYVIYSNRRLLDL